MKRELGDLISRQINFGGALVTVQDVDLTPDLKHAHVFVSVLGGPKTDPRSCIGKLLDHRKDLQSSLAQRVVLKFTPQLHFKLDETVARGSRIIDILQTLDIPADSTSPDDPALDDDANVFGQAAVPSDDVDDADNEEEEDDDEPNDAPPRKGRSRRNG